MKASRIAPLGMCVLLLASCTGDRSNPSDADSRAMQVLAATIPVLDTLQAQADQLVHAVATINADVSAGPRAQQAFIRARAAFKHAELWIETYFIMGSTPLNGPPVDEVDMGEGPTVLQAAHGFQVLEGLLFPSADPTRAQTIQREAAELRDYVTRARTFADSTHMRDWQVFDGIRLEIARIATLGVTGFDSPVRRASLAEAHEALRGIDDAVRPYRDDARRVGAAALARVDSLLADMRSALSTGTFDDFDRLGFIAHRAVPLAHAVADVRNALGIPVPQERRLWRVAVASPFDSGAYDPEALCAGCVPALSHERELLGERLFFDGALSGSGARSCSSCHRPGLAFTDGATTSPALTPTVQLRNAPTLINASLQWAQFADMRVGFLEDQAAAVVANPTEMHGALDTAVARIRHDSLYVHAFGRAFPLRRDSALSSQSILAALAAYVRSLTRLDAPADRAMRGDSTALTADETRGFNLFAGKAGCATCHFLPLTNGTRPPTFTRTEHEVIGVPSMAVWTNATLDPDPGRAGATKAPLHLHAFKIPGVRNVALTAPYMHNGVYRTLDDVVRFYNGGGGAGIGIHLPNQTLPADSLRLSSDEQRALVAFLMTLTDTSRTTRPLPSGRQE